MGMQRGTTKSSRGQETSNELQEKQEPKEQSRLQVVEALLKKVEARLSADVGKTNRADYIRLLQLRNELDQQEPKNITVRWLETRRMYDPEEPEPTQE